MREELPELGVKSQREMLRNPEGNVYRGGDSNA